MADLLNVDDALTQILAALTPLEPERVALPAALDRVLAADLVAAVDLPPFANSSMDGFAVRAADLVEAGSDTPVSLRVTQDIPAGHAPTETLIAGTAARIMTGAPLPDGADAVVPVEATDADWRGGDDNPLPEAVSIRQSVTAGAYVRPVGEDIQTGQTILTAGTIIRPPEIGVLAALGQPEVSVRRQPRVAILSSGDELVDVAETPGPGQIRNSNSYVLEALVRQQGGVAVRIPTARDTVADVRRAFQDALGGQPDLIISSAGVSVGAHDVIRTVLDELGEVALWRVNLRPGKPLAFGHVQGVPFFGLPGNPVSAQVTFDVFVRPALARLSGRPDQTPLTEAMLAEDVPADGRLTYFRVTLRRADDGALIASTTGTQSSGAMRSMVLADGLLIVPAGVKQANAGQRFPVRLLRMI